MEEIQLGHVYLSAAFQQADQLNQYWTYYQTVLLALLAGLVLSRGALPRQSIGRVLLVEISLAAVLTMNFWAVALRGQHFDALLRAAGRHLPDSATVVPEPLPYDNLFAPVLATDTFLFNWQVALIAHVVIDICVLIVTPVILLTGPRQVSPQGGGLLGGIAKAISQ